MRAVCRLPIILDAGGGWGDPAHMHRTIALTEAAGFAAIELEDQLLPRHFEHHVGRENLVTLDLVVKKIEEAVAARTDPNLVIIGRTNARRLHGMDEALRRAEALKKAGADMLFIHARDPEEMRIIGERLPAPLMCFAPPDGFAEYPLKQRDLARLGYRLARLVGHRVRRHAQGGEAVVRVPGERHARSVPRPRRRGARDEGSAQDVRSRQVSGDRAADEEGKLTASRGVRHFGGSNPLLRQRSAISADASAATKARAAAGSVLLAGIAAA